MRLYCFVTVWLLLALLTQCGQQDQMIWGTTIGSNANDKYGLAAVSSINEVYMVLRFEGNTFYEDVDFYNGIGSASICFFKLYPNGLNSWRYAGACISPPLGSLQKSMLIGNDNMYTGATVAAGIGFGAPNTALKNDMAIQKRNAQFPQTLTAKYINSAEDDDLHTIAHDSLNNRIYVAGITGANVTIDSINLTSGLNIFAINTESIPFGVIVQVMSSGENTNISVIEMTVDSTSALLVIGKSTGRVTFGNVSIDDPDLFYFIAKFNFQGEVIWLKKISGGCELLHIKTVPSNPTEFYVLGYVYNASHFESDPTPFASPVKPSVMVLYFTSKGGLVQSSANTFVVFSSEVLTMPADISVTDSYLFVSGTFNSTLTVDGIDYTGTSQENAFIVRVETNSLKKKVQILEGGAKRAYNVFTHQDDLYMFGLTLSLQDLPLVSPVPWTSNFFFTKLVNSFEAGNCKKNINHPLKSVGGFQDACLCNSTISYGVECNSTIQTYSPDSQNIKITDRLRLAVNVNEDMNNYRTMWVVQSDDTEGQTFAVHQLMNDFVRTPENSTFLVVEPKALRDNMLYTFSFLLIQNETLVLSKDFLVTKRSEPIELTKSPGITASMISEPDELFIRYTLFASNWNKGQANRTYSFLYYDQDTSTFVPLTPFLDKESTEVTLPVGVDAASITLMVYLRNEYGNENNATITVEVLDRKPPPLREELNLLKNQVEANVDSATIAVAKYIDSRIDQITSTQDWQGLAGKIIENGLNKLETLNSPETFTNNLLLYLSSTEILTRKQQLQSQESVDKSLDLVNNLITKASRLQNNTDFLYKSLLDKSAFESTALVLSNLARLQDEETATKTLQATLNLAQEKLAEIFVSEGPSEIITPNMIIQVQSELTRFLLNKKIETKNSGLVIPDIFEAETGQSIVKYAIIVLSEANNPYKFANAKNERASDLTDLTFLAPNGSVLPINNLSKPLQLSFPKPVSQDSRRVKGVECRFWHEVEQKWSTEGCRVVSSDNTTVNCECVHTTSFSAFILYHDNSVRTPKVYIAGIVFNSIYIILCVGALVALIISVFSQPARSRFIAPYIGILAVLVDAILNGICRNALLLSVPSVTAVNALSYVIMMVSNPLTLLAMFLFVWQYIRFILSQNIYYIMSNQKENAQYRGTKLITSKYFYIGTTVFAYGIWFIVFGGLTVGGISAKGSTPTERENRAEGITIGTAIYFSASFLLLGAALLVVLVIDLIISMLREASAKQKQTTEDEKKPVNYVSILLDNLIRGDPLYFRIEAVFILVTIAILVLLYPIGIASELTNVSGTFALIVLRVLLEILFMFFKIFSFGGFISIVSLRSFSLKKYRGYSQHKDEKDEGNVMITFFQNPVGYTAMYEYCQKELSLENLLLYTEMESIRSKLISQEEVEKDLKQMLSKVNEVYVKSNSPCEVNLSSKTKKRFTDIVTQQDITIDMCNNALNALSSDVLTNLDDTFSRFTSTVTYKNIVNASKKKEQELTEFSSEKLN
jgi:hypothetical protein